MKKVIFILGFLVVFAGTYGQTSFGIQAGASFAEQKIEINDEEANGYGSTVGLVVGALADIDFGSSISFRPELNFIQKGYKYDETGFESKVVLNYIELSPNFTYNINAGMGNVFVGLGPSFGFGIGGKNKTEVLGIEDEEDVNFGDNLDELKSFDYGFNALAGYKMNMGLFVSAGYNLGLANLSNRENYSVKNRGFNVKIGYMLGGSGRGVTAAPAP